MAPVSRSTSKRRQPKRRRRPRAESRQALVEATLRAMAMGTSLTSGAIAREAGLAQPTFYAYFKSVEEAKLAAAQLAAEQLASQDEERRTRLAERPTDLSALAEGLERWLGQLRRSGPLFDALAPYAREDSTLGAMVRAIAEQTRTRLADDLFGQARAFGVGAEHYPVFLQLAETMLASTSATGRMLSAGQLTDVREAAWVLARSFFGSMRANVIACGGHWPLG
jgi:AcrR family transcriptional regulator